MQNVQLHIIELTMTNGFRELSFGKIEMIDGELSLSMSIGALMGPFGTVGVLAGVYFIRDHANSVYICGDNSFRVAMFNAIWALPTP